MGTRQDFILDLLLFSKFSIFDYYYIYRTAILAFYVKVIDIPKGVRSEIVLTRLNYMLYLQIISLGRWSSL